MEGCCSSLVKFFIILCNILFALAGVVLMGLGIYTQVVAKDYLNFLGNNYVNTPIFIIIVGGVILLISCLGFCGASKESKCLIYTYAVVLFIIILAQVGAAIAAFVLKGDVEGVIEKNMIKGMKNYGNEDSDGVTHTWDIVQSGYKCCGVSNYTDWEKNSDKFSAGQAPDSCCERGIVENCGKQDEAKFWSNGCFEKFKGDFVGNIGIVGGVALGIAACELIAALFACYLGNRMGKGEYV